uniref:Flavin-containing monooxygenase n=1 Tax=Sphenodon punctatus TaxID=8508 RepID=A0A8D0L0W4_SPHPU
MAKQRVAIVGAGVCGLISIKCCLDEGLEPTCFERSSDIGGLWRYEENPEEGRPSIYKSVIINTSKEMMCFSDYPIPDDFPNFMHNSRLMEYFRMYAKHFDLLRYIHFKTNVCSIRKRPNFSSTSQWDVVTEIDGKKESSIFDRIMVCTGHHTYPQMPLQYFPGLVKFKGHFFHSRDYKEPFRFSGKRVVVIGIGNSGVDLAVEISHTAEQVHLNYRGITMPHLKTPRSRPALLFLMAPGRLLVHGGLSNTHTPLRRCPNAKFNHTNYGLQPRHRFLSQHPTINDALQNCILSGRLLVEPNVREFTETATIFEDNTKEENVDVIVFATGYNFSFPFLEDCVEVVENQISLYKYVFPPRLEKPTLAIIGLVQVLGAVMPVAELQARWATRVFKDGGPVSIFPLLNLPLHSRYDYVDYMDELACQLGVKPSLPSLFLTDPKLAWEGFFGPCTPYQFRLRGPGKWDRARNAILTQHERILKSTRTRAVEDSPSWNLLPFCSNVVLIVALLAAAFAYL